MREIALERSSEGNHNQENGSIRLAPVFSSFSSQVNEISFMSFSFSDSFSRRTSGCWKEIQYKISEVASIVENYIIPTFVRNYNYKFWQYMSMILQCMNEEC